MLADAVITDDGKIMNKYVWALEDIQFIQQRYKWFLTELFYKYPVEKKKGQKKKSLAELLLLQNLEAFVSGCSRGPRPAGAGPPGPRPAAGAAA